MAKHLPQDHTHRKDIGLGADFAAACLLGGHVRDFAFEDACGGQRKVVGHPSDPKVRHFDDAFAIEQEIVGRDIAVREVHGLALDIEGVGVMERTQRLYGDLDGVRDRERTALLLSEAQKML